MIFRTIDKAYTLKSIEIQNKKETILVTKTLF